MKNILFITIVITGIILLAGATAIDKEEFSINDNTPVVEVLTKFGHPTPPHTVNPMIQGASAEIGQDIVLNGISRKRGKKSRRQSKHFVCTSCHNVQKEDPDLRSHDPQARLEYAQKNGLSFLQGTTLYGAVNRTSWYNGDYNKKYDAEKIKPAQTDLREAIQLCATECAQGRPLKDWELESVLAYMWTLQLKMSDLSMSDTDKKRLKNEQSDISKYPALAKLVRSYYSEAAPATFTDQPSNLKEGYSLSGNADNGKLVYDLSCKHCHENGRYSMFILDDDKMTYRFMKRNFTKYTRYSTYHVTSYGAATNVKAPYMPNYTLERLSKQQTEDLRAYFEKMSE